MGTYRCSIHGLNFPSALCPVEGCTAMPWWYNSMNPDPDWEAKALAAGPDVPFEEPPMLEPVPVVDTDVRHYAGRDWVAHDDLIEAGYLNLEDFDVVRIRTRFYELQGHVGRTLTHGIKGGAWWIEEIKVEEQIAEMFGGI